MSGTYIERMRISIIWLRFMWRRWDISFMSIPV
jgi:hypothetical protein